MSVKPKMTLQQASEKAEKDLIEKTLKENHYNATRTASALGTTRQLLYRRMAKYGIKRHG